ncbi:MAG: SH3 domain-containing protein [Lachnospiraceae bacterium]|nr:SH3 domain-containing protein [Lachnospiraceae bacterium]
MQRNILKKFLMCSILFLLIFTSINDLYAAENAIETNVNLDESISGTYYVNAQNGLKMRSAPSTDADVVALLPYKAEITVTGAATNSWYQVEYANQSGYVAANYLTKSSTSDTGNETADTNAAQTQENTLVSEEDTADAFGATSIITALIVAIIIMILLATYTAYSFLKRGNDNAAEEYDDEYDDDEEYDDEYDDEPEYNDDTYDGDDNSEYDDEDEYDDEES